MNGYGAILDRLMPTDLTLKMARSSYLNDDHHSALQLLDCVVGLDPASASAHHLSGLTHAALGNRAVAIGCFDRAVALQGNHLFRAQYLADRAVEQRMLLRLDEAHDGLTEALRLDPSCHRAVWEMSQLQLLRGHWGQEWRQQYLIGPNALNDEAYTVWTGEQDIAGKTVLVASGADGLGDVIQRSRYIPMMEAMGANVIAAVQRPLLGIIPNTIDRAGLLAGRTTGDYFCSMPSLPGIFKTTVDNVPPSTIIVPAAKKEAMSFLAPKDGRRHIGIKWAGNPDFHLTKWRDVPLGSLLKALKDAALDDVQYHCLQINTSPAEDAQLAEAGVFRSDLALGDFADTAGLMANLDAVITVDTAVAHMAGSVGCSTFMLTPFSPDPRWLLDREDTPWYPSMRLFRQTSDGDWSGPLERLRQVLGG